MNSYTHYLSDSNIGSEAKVGLLNGHRSASLGIETKLKQHGYVQSANEVMRPGATTIDSRAGNLHSLRSIFSSGITALALDF